jgi:fatty-acyl-CoA synthase
MANDGLGSWPARRARMSPERIALKHDGDAVSYGELADRVRRLAHALLDLGVGVGDRVAYLGPNQPAFLECLFATGAVGGVFVPLNIRLAPAELAYMLDDSQTSVLFVDESLAGLAAELGELRTVRRRISTGGGQSGEYGQLLAAATDISLPAVDVSLDDVCMIMYTSGTTGQPKGAMLTHGNLTWNCYNLLLDLDLTGAEVALVSAPMFHTAALNHTALPVFLKGGTSVLVGKFDPASSFDLIAEHRITLMFGVPAMFQQIALSDRWATADLSSLRILHCGGSPVPEALIRTYQDRGLTFVQGYGMTESSPGVMVLRPEDTIRKVGSAGKPHFFTEARIVSPDGHDVADGQSGEIVVRGPNVMKGYWNRQTDTDAALADGWLHTGDIGIQDQDGFFFIVDRVKDMIISGGENIYPAEVERVLHEHPAIAECCVVGVQDERWGEVGRAIVVPKAGTTIDPDEVLAFLTARLAKYKVPKTVVTAQMLAHNATGKLRRNDIKQEYGAR